MNLTDEELDLILRALNKQLHALGQVGVPKNEARLSRLTDLRNKVRTEVDKRYPARTEFAAIRAARKAAPKQDTQPQEVGSGGAATAPN